jgi:hypothetical protein
MEITAQKNIQPGNEGAISGLRSRADEVNPGVFEGFLQMADKRAVVGGGPEGPSGSDPLKRWLRAEINRFVLNDVPVQRSRSLQEQWRIYKEDQLLSHPGGDEYDLQAPDPRKAIEGSRGFWQRIKKDLKDAFANVKNFFKDLLWGSSYRYVDRAGRVRTASRKGILANITEFFKDAVSGLSFGYIRPEGEPEPRGFVERIKYAYRKFFGEGIVGDLVLGVPSSALNMVDDAAIALWNFLEVIPDATIGAIPGGDKLVTKVFDNGQLIIDYITDCMPTGEAWMRVHAYNLDSGGIVPPVLYNLRLPERYTADPRWRTVRNTPFRKAIETIGSLLADFWMARLTSHAIRTSRRRD